MSAASEEQKKRANLRITAETRLKQGAVLSSPGGMLSVDALAVLYKLAGDPDSAGEGLKLLHELQTHQVELDIQREQMETDERELSRQLEYYKALYDFAPVACLVVCRDGRILDSNPAGAELLGIACDQLDGRKIDSLAIPADRSMLSALLNNFRAGTAVPACIVRCNGVQSPDSGLLRVAANLLPGGETALVVVSEQDQ